MSRPSAGCSTRPGTAWRSVAPSTCCGVGTPERTRAVVQAPPRGGRSFAALRADLGQALLDLDADRADDVLAEAFTLFSVEDVCLQVLQPLLVDIGDRWHAGELSVAEEHYATSFVRARLFGLLQAYQPPHTRGPLVFTACAPDEWHEVGILIVSVFLARRGVSVRYLGPNLPLEGLAAIVAPPSPRRGRALGPESGDGAQAAPGGAGRAGRSRHPIHSLSSVARRSTATPGCAPASRERMSVQMRRPRRTLSRVWSKSPQQVPGRRVRANRSR